MWSENIPSHHLLHDIAAMKCNECINNIAQCIPWQISNFLPSEWTQSTNHFSSWPTAAQPAPVYVIIIYIAHWRHLRKSEAESICLHSHVRPFCRYVSNQSCRGSIMIPKPNAWTGKQIFRTNLCSERLLWKTVFANIGIYQKESEWMLKYSNIFPSHNKVMNWYYWVGKVNYFLYSKQREW